MLDFIAIPLGFVLKIIYDTIAFQNYGLSIIIFTVTIKTLILPLSIKQSLSATKLKDLQPKMKFIQEKYSSDKEKMNSELLNLYRENNANPVSGCLPILIQMPILFSLYYVISQPLKYMVSKSNETINILYNIIPDTSQKISSMKDISVINYFKENPHFISQFQNLISHHDIVNMEFLGINLGIVPTWNPIFYLGDMSNLMKFSILLIPILSALTSYISTHYSLKYSISPSDDALQASMQKNMLLIAPIMSGIISFTVPSGLGLYWITSNLYQIFQQILINMLTRRNIK